MKIGGIQRVSLIDYPGAICAVIFTQGCNFRCPYCHNPELVNPKLFQACLGEEQVLSFLMKRRGLLDAVSITGGEPSIQTDLIDFIRRIKDMGYGVKIDTNGSRPEVLQKLVEEQLVDYLAMDVKGPLEKYHKITGTGNQENQIKQSIDLIMTSGLPYEFRTTVVKSLLDRDDLIDIGNLIKGARLYAIQPFVPSKTLDAAFLSEKAFEAKDLEVMKEALEKVTQRVIVRAS